MIIMKLRKTILYSSVVLGSIILTSCHGTLVPKETFVIPTTFIDPVESSYSGTIDPSNPTGTGIIDPTGTTTPQENPLKLVTPINPIDFSDVDVNANYTITFWDKNDTNEFQVRVFQDAISNFQSLYPNITVKMKHYTDYGYLYEDILRNIQTKTTPNIAISYPDHAAVYSENKTMLVKMQDLVNSPDYGLGSDNLKFQTAKFEDLYENYYNEGLVIDIKSGNNNTYEQNIWTMPFMRSTELLYVNKTWLDEHNFAIPEDGVFSWDYIWEICEWAKNNDSSIVYPFLYQSKDNCVITMMKQRNIPYTSRWGEMLFNNAQTVSLFQHLDDINSKGWFTVKDAIGKYPSFYMNTGREIFAIDSSAGSTWIGTNCPVQEKTDDETTYEYELYITTIPQEDVKNPTAISQGPSLCIFNKENKGEVWASWLFLQYLLTNEVQVGFAKTEGYLPVTKTAVDSAEFKAILDGTAKITYDKNVGAVDVYKGHKDALNVALKYNDSTFISPPFAQSAAARSEMAGIMYQIAIGKNIFTETEIQGKLKKALKACGVK